MLQEIAVTSLTQAEYNPRQIDQEAFDRLKSKLKDDPDFLRERPCLVNKRPDGRLIVYAGNRRMQAAKALGWEKVWCSVVEIDEELERKRSLRDNLHEGDWDMDILANEFGDIDTLLAEGFKERELDLDFFEKEVDVSDYDRWMEKEGLEKDLTNFICGDLRGKIGKQDALELKKIILERSGGQILLRDKIKAFIEWAKTEKA